MVETVERATWPTPRGRVSAVFDYRYRPETTDWNTVNSIMGDANNADEYGIAGLDLHGWAIDVGAHIGGMTIALALDHPGLRVIAIEPIGANVDLLRHNLELNGLGDRITVLQGAAGVDGECTINWNWSDGSDGLQGHRYIGGSSLALSEPTATHEATVVPSWSLASLCHDYGIEEIALLKIDCEGCEATFLDSSAVKRIVRIVGEFHPPHIDRAGILRLLGKTHDVTFDGPVAGPGGFTAIRR